MDMAVSLAFLGMRPGGKVDLVGAVAGRVKGTGSISPDQALAVRCGGTMAAKHRV
jgi:hypothetical protein